MDENLINVRIKQKRDTEANWKNNNPILLEGELCFSSDKNNAFKIGDGISKWSELEYNTNYNIIIDTALSDTSTNPVQNKVIKSALDGKADNNHTHSDYLTEHPTIATSSDTTSTVSPSAGGTFTVVDSVTRDSNGHVTKVNTKTVTLPNEVEWDNIQNKPTFNSIVCNEQIEQIDNYIGIPQSAVNTDGDRIIAKFDAGQWEWGNNEKTQMIIRAGKVFKITSELSMTVSLGGHTLNYSVSAGYYEVTKDIYIEWDIKNDSITDTNDDANIGSNLIYSDSLIYITLCDASGMGNAKLITEYEVKRNIEDEITYLKKSVSDGKTTVANAITEKGVETATDTTFAIMAENIGKISSGSTVTIDGKIWQGEALNFSYHSTLPVNNNTSTLPYNFDYGQAVIYNGEIHILGGGNSSTEYTKHYKFDGSDWVEVSALPYELNAGSAVVFNNEIHILGTFTLNVRPHYKYDGSTWTKASTLPYDFMSSSAVIYNGEIHILGGYMTTDYCKHYKYDGSTWTEVSTLPYGFRRSQAVVFNNEIHILGSDVSGNGTKHYKYDGSTWTKVSTLPYDFNYGQTVVFNNEIHILGSNVSGNTTKHYKYNGSAWIQVPNLPYDFYRGSAVVFNNEIHILGSGNNSCYNKHYVVCITLYKRN